MPEASQTEGEGRRRGLLGSTVVIGAITSVSRILGLVREQVKAHYLGTGLASDAFSTAYIVPNLLRRLVAEGAMTASFVPVFSDYVKGRTKEEIWEFAESFFVFLTAVLALLSVVGVLTAPLYIRYFFATGYADVPGKVELTVWLTQLQFPYILLVSLAALAQAILNSHDRFAVPAAAPILLNLAMVVCAVAFARSFETPATGFAIGVLVGGVLQLVCQLPSLWSLGMRFRSRVNLGHPGILRVLWLMAPGVLGVGIYQINMAVAEALASRQAGGAVASLQYSSRLLELVLGIFVVSLATVILPSLSRQATAGDLSGMSATGRYALSLVAFVCVPATVGTIVLRGPIVDLLFRFKGGQFDDVSSAMTQAAVAAHVSGLLCIGGVRIAAQLFFALKDTKTPVVTAALGAAVNIAGCLLLPRWFEHAGIALANSLAALVQMVLLLALVVRRLPDLNLGALAGPVARIVACSAVMGFVCHEAASRFVPPWPCAKDEQAVAVLGVVALSTAVYALLGALTGSPEMRELSALLRRRLGRAPVC